MTTPVKFEKIGDDTECGRILNKYFVGPLRTGFVRYGGAIFSDIYPEYAEKIKHFDIREDDIFVCGYPKSGTTWTQEMVWCIANDLNFEEAKATDLKLRFPFIGMSTWQDFNKILNKEPATWMEKCMKDSVKFLEEAESPRFIKSHEPFHLLPEKLKHPSAKTKIVYVCRDPKDVCVSYFHFSRSFDCYSGDLEAFCKLFLNDMLPWSPYWNHVLKFWEQRNNSRFLFLKYEDMKKDLPSVIRKTAAFLGKELSEDQVASLADHLSFENMKKNPAIIHEHFQAFVNKFLPKPIAGDFFRSGSTGQGKKEMSPEILEKFDIWTKEKTAGTDFQFSD